MQYSYVNDQFVPKEKALISIEDRGFRFGDGVFETIRLHRYIPYQWELHLARLQTGLGTLKIDIRLNPLWQLCQTLIQKNNAQEGFLRITITRGIGSSGYLPTQSTASQATLVIETLPLSAPPPKPASLWLCSMQKPSAKSLPIHTKTAQGLNSTLARMEAQQQGCFEGVLLGERQQICEGSSSNIFWYRDHTLFTPAESAGLVPGTTRAAVLRLAPCPVVEGLFLLKDLQHAEEVFVTNTSWQILPVSHLEPLALRWHSFRFATQLQQRLADDMNRYATHFTHA